MYSFDPEEDIKSFAKKSSVRNLIKSREGVKFFSKKRNSNAQHGAQVSHSGEILAGHGSRVGRL